VDVEHAADLYAQGRTLRQIGAEVGVTATTVGEVPTLGRWRQVLADALDENLRLVFGRRSPIISVERPPRAELTAAQCTSRGWL
jgi:hypothetical protein